MRFIWLFMVRKSISSISLYFARSYCPGFLYELRYIHFVMKGSQKVEAFVGSCPLDAAASHFSGVSRSAKRFSLPPISPHTVFFLIGHVASVKIFYYSSHHHNI
jgi:hypothetical protein